MNFEMSVTTLQTPRATGGALGSYRSSFTPGGIGGQVGGAGIPVISGSTSGFVGFDGSWRGVLKIISWFSARMISEDP